MEDKVSKQIQLRQKIKAIQTTQKITNAIRQVSMSLYSKLEHQSATIKNYTQNLTNLFTKLIAYDDTWSNPLMSPKKPDSNPLIIIVATSKGLCGGLNSNMYKFIAKALEIKNFQNPKFVTIGYKALTFTKDQKLGEIVLSYNDFSLNNYISIANNLITKIADGSLTYSSVTIFYNESKSFFVQKTVRHQLIPVKIDSENTSTTDPHKIYADLIWEQNPHEILDALSIRYIKGQMIHCLFQALIAEYSARFVAMDSSTVNAEKYIEKLTLAYNKMRQADITREVSGLCAGFMNKNS